MLKYIKKLFNFSTYRSDLECYILSKNPVDQFQIEQLEKEFNQKLSEGKITC